MDRHPHIGQLQHPYQRRAQRLPRLPQQPPAQVRHAGHCGNRCHGPALQAESIGKQQHQHRAQRHLFDPGPLGRRRTGHPVVGEHRNDPPAHDHHNEQHRIQCDLQACPRRHGQRTQGRQVEECRHCSQQYQQRHEKVIAAVARLEERHRQPGGCRQGKRHIGHGCGERVRRQHQDPRQQPQGHQSAQLCAGGRGQIGPVATGSQQKADDDGQGETKQHFMGMPDHATEIRTRQQAGELQRPQRHRQGGKNAGQQIERPKAKCEQRKALGLQSRGVFKLLQQGHGVVPSGFSHRGRLAGPSQTGHRTAGGTVAARPAFPAGQPWQTGPWPAVMVQRPTDLAGHPLHKRCALGQTGATMAPHKSSPCQTPHQTPEFVPMPFKVKATRPARTRTAANRQPAARRLHRQACGATAARL